MISKESKTRKLYCKSMRREGGRGKEERKEKGKVMIILLIGD